MGGFKTGPGPITDPLLPAPGQVMTPPIIVVKPLPPVNTGGGISGGPHKKHGGGYGGGSGGTGTNLVQAVINSVSGGSIMIQGGTPVSTNYPTQCAVLLNNKLPPMAGYSLPAGIGVILVAGTTTYLGKPFSGPYFNNAAGEGGSLVLVDTTTKTVVQLLQGVSTTYPTQGGQLITTHEHTGAVDVNNNIMPAPINTPQQLPNASPSTAPAISGATLTPVPASGTVSSHVDAAWTITNQPTDGSISRIGMLYRQTGVSGWTKYSDVPVAGLPTPPASQAYTFTYADLTNGVGYDFAVVFEDTQGGESVTGSLGSITAQSLIVGTSNEWTSTSTDAGNGYITGIHGVLGNTTVNVATGGITTVVASIIKASAAVTAGLFLTTDGTNQNGYGVELSDSGTNKMNIYVVVAGSKTILANQTMTSDTKQHTYQLILTQGNPNNIEALVDAVNLYTQDSSF